MKPLSWAWVTVRRGVVAGPAALGALTFLVVVTFACLTLSASVSRAVMHDYVARGTLGQVEVSAPVDGGDTRLLVRQAVDDLGRVPGVSGIVVKYTASLPWTERATVLAGSTWSDLDKVDLVAGRGVQTTREIVLPERVQGTSTRGLVGSTITVDVVRRVAEGQGRTTPEAFTVTGVYSVDRAPERPDTAYVAEADARRLAAAREGLAAPDYDRTRGADRVVLQTRSTEVARGVAQRLREQRFDARATADRVADVSGAPGLVRISGWALAVLACLVVAASAASRANESGTRRLREFALLRGLGWTLRDIAALVIVESALVTGITVGLGILLTVPLAWVGMEPLLSMMRLSGSGYLPVPLLLVATLTLVAVATTGALVGVRRALTEDPYLVARRQV